MIVNVDLDTQVIGCETQVFVCNLQYYECNAFELNNNVTICHY